MSIGELTQPWRRAPTAERLGSSECLSSTLAHFRSPISQKSRENQANSTFATPPESLGFAKTRATIAETLENRAILGPENGPKSNLERGYIDVAIRGRSGDG